MATRIEIVRGMDDDDFALFLTSIQSDICEYFVNFGTKQCDFPINQQGWLEWFRKECVNKNDS